MRRAYFGAYLAILFPRLADLYERITKKEIPYKRNNLIFAKFPERENLIEGARFKFLPKSRLEQTASSK